MGKKAKDTYEDLVILYLKFRNAYSFGFVRYGIFRKLIQYTTGIHCQKKIRIIFQNLLSRDIFDKSKYRNKNMLYRFNPEKRIETKEEKENKLIVKFR